MDMINQFLAILSELNAIQISIITFGVAVIWFLPAIVASVLNPKHAKYILVSCVPAGFSIIAWSGLMIWACTGKVFDKYKDKVKENEAEKASAPSDS